MRLVPALVFLSLLACDPDGDPNDTNPGDASQPNDTSDTSQPNDTQDDDPDRPDEFVNTWSGSDNGSDPLPSGAPDFVYYGNIADGEDGDYCSWGTSVAGWPGTICAEYSGNHVWYDVDQPQIRDIYIRLTPSDGVDLNLFTLQRPSGSTAKPPDAGRGTGGNGWQMFGKQGSNPGQPEVLCDYTSTLAGPYSLLIGVAGAFGEDDGWYKLEIWDRPGSLCGGS